MGLFSVTDTAKVIASCNFYLLRSRLFLSSYVVNATMYVVSFSSGTGIIVAVAAFVLYFVIVLLMVFSSDLASVNAVVRTVLLCMLL
jgi:hypothetical protein